MAFIRNKSDSESRWSINEKIIINTSGKNERNNTSRENSEDSAVSSRNCQRPDRAIGRNESTYNREKESDEKTW